MQESKKVHDDLESKHHQNIVSLIADLGSVSSSRQKASHVLALVPSIG